jgi:hypothetical protein
MCYGYDYLISTIKNINRYKNTTISQDTLKFIAAENIYIAYKLIEDGVREQFISILHEAISEYLNSNFEEANKLANLIKDVVHIETPSAINLTNFALFQNYPNPFNPTTVISYQLPVISDVELTIFNTIGQKVATLVSEKQPAGLHKYEWDAGNMASGIYYFKLWAGDFTQTKKLVLLR